MTYQGEILLVPFPFSDQSGKKVRPVVVISNDNFNKNSADILVMGLTSNISKDKYTINLNNSDLEEEQIELCCIKVENILRLDKSLIIKKIGKIKKTKLNEAIKILNDILKEEN